MDDDKLQGLAEGTFIGGQKDQPITWVIDNIINERNFYQTGFPTLAEAARELGHDVIETKYVPFRDRSTLEGHIIPQFKIGNLERGFYGGDGSRNFDHKRPVLFHGSHEFIRAARNTSGLNTDCCPLAYCREENLRFSTYAAHHGEKMLSEGFRILPYAEVVRRYRGSNKDIFIRPNEVTKAFAGRVINGRDFDHEINSLNQIEKIDPETLCVVASPREIAGEFRMIIVDGKVITGSEYRWDDKLDIRIDVDERCWKLAEEVAAHPWQPDRVYVCDVALEVSEIASRDLRPRLIELNSFSCAGLYACDTRKIVEAVSRAANKEYFGLD